MMVIGIGNEYRHDDAVGLHIARAFKEKDMPHVKVIEHSGEGTNLIESWVGVDKVIICDAMQSNDVPGTFCRFDAYKDELPAAFASFSTHSFSLADAIEMARALGRLPKQLIIYGIVGEDFSAGTGLSKELQAVVSNIIKRIETQLTCRS